MIVQNNIHHYLIFKAPCNHWITTPRLKRAFTRKIPIPFTPRRKHGDYSIPPQRKDLNRKDFDQPLLFFETILFHKLDLCDTIRKKLE